MHFVLGKTYRGMSGDQEFIGKCVGIHLFTNIAERTVIAVDLETHEHGLLQVRGKELQSLEETEEET